jgi:cyclopropane-fatty-acyl-phospholipid synthase
MKILFAPSAGLPWSRTDSRVRQLAPHLPRAAAMVLRLLNQLAHGRLSLTLPEGKTLEFGSGSPHAVVRLRDYSVFADTLKSGDIGFAESYIDGGWTTDSLIDVLDLMVANRRVLDAAIYGRWWGQALYRLRHWLNRNSRGGARRNIQAHYDLGNPFYSLWLDPGMTYSSALFEDDPARALEQAQRAKYRRLFDQLRAPAGAKLLEIGCGWGGFAELAASLGAQVTGLTLSAEQHRYATERLASAGLSGRATIALRDYRDESGDFDGIVSIEMFEAVGEQYWPEYFATLARRLKVGGRAVIQTIVIADELFERYRRGTDFIQQYIFPGGMLPSPARFEALAGDAGLAVIDRFGFGFDYARTLSIWRAAFAARSNEVRALGFDDRFMRLWEFYLAYCEAAFSHRNTDVIQFTLQHR